MYTDTEEAWFSNWEYDDAYWNKDKSEAAKRTYANSPHLNVDKWDTPILVSTARKTIVLMLIKEWVLSMQLVCVVSLLSYFSILMRTTGY